MTAHAHHALRRAFVLLCLVLAAAAVPSAAQDEKRAARGKLQVDGVTLSYPSGWSHQRHASFDRLTSAPVMKGARIGVALRRGAAQVSVHTERRASHAEAVRRLQEIALEQAAPVTFLTIGGWPALERKQVQPRPLSGERDAGEGGSDGDESDQILVMTTAVAVDDRLIRIESWLPPDASRKLVAQVRAVGRSLVAARSGDPEQVEREVEGLKQGRTPGGPVSALPSSRQVPTPMPAEELPGATPAEDAAGQTVAVRVGAGVDSEIEVAVSGNGRNLVVGTNNNFHFSTNGGETWAVSNLGRNGNDPSLAWGSSGGANGTFYAANIGRAAAMGPSDSTDFRVSTNGGSTFNFQAFAYTCGQGGDPACGATFPDQEHIAADRVNVTGTGDQVYSVWRHLDGNWGIVCSVNSGATWSTNGFFTGGDFPRVTVGQDGNVYVTYLTGGNVMLRRFNSCATNQNPMVAAAPATVVAGITNVACPTPGLDRCNFRNTLASPIPAVDDTNANHVYVAYAVNTNPGGGGSPNCANQATCNENVVVQDSPDLGVTWNAADPTRTVTVSTAPTARRFMPWVCALGGVAHVAWYDRRAASPGGTTVSNNSLTDLFRASAFLDGGGNLVAGAETRINDAGTADAHCEAAAATGSQASWPAVVDQPGDSESCSLQPQIGGFCCIPADISPSNRCTPSAASSRQACDFNQTACPMGEQCAASRGFPKYGDYNGVACGMGRFSMAWASATAPTTGIGTPNDIDTFFRSELVCCVPRIDAPANIVLPPTCAGATGNAALHVCNTGFGNLAVSGIASSNPQFSVPDAYPVNIAEGACHDFNVAFTPTSRGPKAATLTISSNDNLRPTITVAATGQGKGLVSITCPADVTAPNDPGLCSAVVNPGTPVVDAEGCPANVTGVRDDGLLLTDPYPVGDTVITWTATDGGGNSLACAQTIVVNDVEPPQISGEAAVPDMLWPPNHKMRDVAINYTVTDNCDPLAAITCELGVSSNEPVNGIGDGNTAPDWMIVNTHLVQLRSERAGGGTGRIYTVGIVCEDTKNNASQTAVQVTVPHDRGH
jgi:hypothetical protein